MKPSIESIQKVKEFFTKKDLIVEELKSESMDLADKWLKGKL
jgi:hypothetical protein